MASTTPKPATYSVTITEEERGTLVDYLRHVLGETRVEAHRTHTPGYREAVLHRETVVKNLIEKLSPSRVERAAVSG
jgi:hypothetical protein